MQRLPRVSSGLLLAALVSLTSLLTPATAQANPLTPASPQARLQADLFWVTLGIAMVVLVAVEFLIIYTSLRFRKRRGARAIVEPPQIHGNTRLEIMWTFLPGIILISLFIISVQSMSRLGAIPQGGQTIQVTGRQFAWEFAYPGTPVKTINDLRVPVNQPVVLEITSGDVIHSFWVPDLGGKMDANPGLVNRMSFTAEREGQFRAVCAELCGIGHANMLFTVTAMSPGEFQTWLAEGGQAAASQAAAAASGPSPEAGRALVTGRGGCGTCHTIAGVGGMSGVIGPPLTNIGSVAATRKPGTSAQDYLNESIANPNAFVVPGFAPAMPPNGLTGDLTEQDRAAIVAYLMTLK
jgi:cytochrome c oxidase subunit II